MVKHLLIIHKTLGSIPSTDKIPVFLFLFLKSLLLDLGVGSLVI